MATGRSHLAEDAPSPTGVHRIIRDSLLVGDDLGSLIDTALERHLQGSRRMLLIHGTTFARRTGVREQIEAHLGRHGRVWRFELNPSETDTVWVSDCVRRITELEIDLVVALGGGRVMDIAKVCASFREFDFRTDLEAVLGRQHHRIPTRTVALIAIPTTPGTGSEATPYAVLTGRENRKLFAISSQLRPDVGIIFPPVYATVSAEVARQSLMDGFTHALEALWSRKRTDISDEYAIQSLEQFGSAMIPYYRNPHDLRLAEGVSTAATLGGLAFATAYTSLCHALSFPLAERLHLGHGQCCALTAAHVAEFNSDYETPALQRTVRMLGLKGVNELPAYLHTLRDALEDRVTLSSFGVTDPMLAAIAARARSDMVSNNAKPTNSDDLVRILHAAL